MRHLLLALLPLAACGEIARDTRVAELAPDELRSSLDVIELAINHHLHPYVAFGSAF